MSENKSKNLLFLLLLAALVIIAIMGSYIFNLNNTIDTLTPPEGALSEEDAISKATTVLSKYVALSNFETNGVGPMPYLLAELGLDTNNVIEILRKEEDVFNEEYFDTYFISITY